MPSPEVQAYILARATLTIRIALKFDSLRDAGFLHAARSAADKCMPATAQAMPSQDFTGRAVAVCSRLHGYIFRMYVRLLICLGGRSQTWCATAGAPEMPQPMIPIQVCTERVSRTGIGGGSALRAAPREWKQTTGLLAWRFC